MLVTAILLCAEPCFVCINCEMVLSAVLMLYYWLKHTVYLFHIRVASVTLQTAVCLKIDV